MPRRKFDKIPEIITGSDFVKADDYFQSLHWNYHVYIYKDPYTKQFALISDKDAQSVRTHAFSISRGLYTPLKLQFYRTIRQLCAVEQEFLQQQMRTGNPYKRIMQQTL